MEDEMGKVTLVKLRAVQTNALPNGSWSSMLITNKHIDGNQSTLGVSLFRPGTISTAISHEVEEVVYVTRGQGELGTDDGPISFGPGDALFVPPNTWHWVANTGDEDVEMVFGFPFPEYPPTQRREE
jgi:quercetin dioxygenase-like cupin family protein